MKLNTKKNLKEIKETISVLKALHKDNPVNVDTPKNKKGKISGMFKRNENREFLLEFEDSSYSFNLEDIENISIDIAGYNLIIDRLLVTSISLPRITGKFLNFYTKGFDKKTKYYFRLLIPIKKTKNVFFLIEDFVYETEMHTSRGCLKVGYKNVPIEIYTEKNDEDNYLILETSKRLSLKQFSDYCYSTLVSFGYVTGTLFQDEGYYFSYDSPHLKHPIHINYRAFRKSIYTDYTPVYENAHGYIRDSQLANNVSPTLRPISSFEFSKLCQWTYDSIDFLAILLLIIESCSSSLLVMPSGLSVALEGLTELLIKNKGEQLLPIKDKKIAKKVRNEISKIIKIYSSEIDSEGQKVLKSRVENINQLTNRNKLIKPFELLGFTLSKEDIKAIEHRNDFLHGKTSLTMENNGDGNKEVYYVSLRIYTLLAVLILKSIGFDNKIVNYPKINEDAYDKKLDEPHFRQI